MKAITIAAFLLTLPLAAAAKPLVVHTVPDHKVEDVATNDLVPVAYSVEQRENEIRSAKLRRTQLKAERKHLRLHKRLAHRVERAVARGFNDTVAQGPEPEAFAKNLAVSAARDTLEQELAVDWSKDELRTNKLGIRAKRANHSRALAWLERKQARLAQRPEAGAKPIYLEERFDRQLERISERANELTAAWEVEQRTPARADYLSSL